jgi:hypothetical protein
MNTGSKAAALTIGAVAFYLFSHGPVVGLLHPFNRAVSMHPALKTIYFPNFWIEERSPAFARLTRWHVHAWFFAANPGTRNKNPRRRP